MLTAEHIDARRRGDELVLSHLDAKTLREAHTLAEAYLEAAQSHVGHVREELVEAWKAISAGARKRRLAAGLEKIVDEACTFDDKSALDPKDVRQALFLRAAELRRGRTATEQFDRNVVLREVATTLGRAPDDLERSMFADLRGEHVLRGAPTLNARSVVESYELGRAQAVLLRAVRVRCEVKTGSPGAMRAFFAWLKFQRLLFTAERGVSGGFAVTIDGPFSMFESVTRYGLRLALLVPALRMIESWSLVADIRWGKERVPLVFRMSSTDGSRCDSQDPEPHLSEDVRTLKDGIEALRSPWRVEITTTLLDHPGLGVCIPDLVLYRDGQCDPVYVEVLGFWSRDAVWKRVELAQRGLHARIVFCASSRLRVSAEILDDNAPAALYVYKGKPSARTLIERAERVAGAALLEPTPVRSTMCPTP